jgi:hypothetical protein
MTAAGLVKALITPRDHHSDPSRDLRVPEKISGSTSYMTVLLAALRGDVGACERGSAVHDGDRG